MRKNALRWLSRADGKQASLNRATRGLGRGELAARRDGFIDERRDDLVGRALPDRGRLTERSFRLRQRTPFDAVALLAFGA